MEFRHGIHHGRRGQLVWSHPVYIHPTVYIDTTGDVVIGAGVSLSRDCQIYTHDHYHNIDLPLVDNVEENGVKVSDLTIGDHTYIGAGVIITAGVTLIGKHAVIGAGSVLTHNVGDYEVWAGNPARLIKKDKRDG